MEIQAVLFDYGLVLTGPPLPEAWVSMQKAFGADENTFAAAYWKSRLDYDRGTLTGEAYWRAVGEEIGTVPDGEQVNDLTALDTRLWTQVNQPMVDWALRLQRAGTRTGILSNLGDSMMYGVLKELDWMHGFDQLTFSHTLGLVKPDPAIYRHAAQGLGTPPAAVLFIDDRPENIAGAEAAGMQAIAYPNQEEFLKSIRGRGLDLLWESGHVDGGRRTK